MELWYWLTSVDNGPNWIDGPAEALEVLKNYGAIMMDIQENEWMEKDIDGHTCYVWSEDTTVFTLVPVSSGLGTRWEPEPLDN